MTVVSSQSTTTSHPTYIWLLDCHPSLCTKVYIQFNIGSAILVLLKLLFPPFFFSWILKKISPFTICDDNMIYNNCVWIMNAFILFYCSFFVFQKQTFHSFMYMSKKIIHVLANIGARSYFFVLFLFVTKSECSTRVNMMFWIQKRWTCWLLINY